MATASNITSSGFLIETSTADKRFDFITDARSSKLLMASVEKQPQANVTFVREGSRKHEKQIFDLDVLVDVKGWKALGNRLTKHKVKDIAQVENGSATANASANGQSSNAVGDQVEWLFDRKKKDQLGMFDQ